MKPQASFRIVAIDGPAGAGKSTVAKEVARRLGFLYLDTGALYRAVALFFLESRTDAKDAKQVSDALSKLDLRLDAKGQVFLSGEDVSAKIRSREIAALVSQVAAIPAVRAKLLKIQQAMGEAGGEGGPAGLVAEGRDIGTVVFPQAKHKVFLIANLEERAKRRQKEFVRDGQVLSVAEVMREIALRDEKDSLREVSPLRKAPDAVEIDTTGLSIDGAVSAILRAIET